MPDFVAGRRSGVVGGRAGVFVGADDGEENVGEHGEGDPAGPGGATAKLVLVQGGQADAVSGVREPFGHRAGRFRSGRADDVLAEPHRLAPVLVAGPGPGYVQFPVHRRTASGACTDETDANPGVPDPPGRAGVLTPDADGVGPLPRIAGLVHGRRRGGVGVPDGPAQQTMRAVRVASPARPAIVRQFSCGRPGSRPSTDLPARRRSSHRVNRLAARPAATSNASRHRTGSTLWPAATASSPVRTPHGGRSTVAVSVRRPVAVPRVRTPRPVLRRFPTPARRFPVQGERLSGCGRQ
ncbi:hypothetical protein SUDANB6_05386 [Streptomyces sp. enrichment culture]